MNTSQKCFPRTSSASSTHATGGGGRQVRVQDAASRPDVHQQARHRVVIVSMQPASARSSAFRRPFWMAMPAAAATEPSRTPRRLVECRSWRRAATCVPPRSTIVTARPHEGVGSGTGLASASTQSSRSPIASTPISSFGSPNASASASRIGTPLCERDHDVGHRRAREPRPQDPEQERERGLRRTRRRRSARSHRPRPGGEHRASPSTTSAARVAPPATQDGPERPAQRGGCSRQAPHLSKTPIEREDDAGGVPIVRERVREPRRVQDEQLVLGAVGARRHRRRVDEDDGGRERDQRRADDPREHRVEPDVEPACRVERRSAEKRERRPRLPIDEADREHPGVVGLRQGAREPQ